MLQLCPLYFRDARRLKENASDENICVCAKQTRGAKAQAAFNGFSPRTLRFRTKLVLTKSPYVV
jgi:hypothetical protein